MKNKLAVAASILNKVKLPKISNEVSKLQEESMKPDPDILVVTQCISRNPKLFTKFIAIASFVSKKEIVTARQAVDILGTKGVFSIFFSSAIEFSFRASGDSELIINHAIKVATAMAELSNKVEGVKTSDAYLFGLLYNIGYVVLSLYEPDAYKSCYLTSLTRPSESEEMELETFGTTNNFIGVYVARKWHVKNSIYSGILFQQAGAEKCKKGENRAYELINLLKIARMVVAETEDMRFVTEEIKHSAFESMQLLGIGNKSYIYAQKRVRQLTKDLKSMPEDGFGIEE